MKKLAKTALAGLLFLALASPSFAAKKATVKIINQSKWEIHHLYISPSEQDEWGPDQLEDEILTKGQSLTITNIPCNTYDVKVIDEDGDECVIEAADLCANASYWKITDKDLLACEGYDE